MNQHTCGAVFNAYAMVNRLDLAMATWNELAGRGFDIGPFGSSALIKACARARNIGAALQVCLRLLGTCRKGWQDTAVLCSAIVCGRLVVAWCSIIIIIMLPIKP
jgi:hypothetical protein